MEFDDKNTQQVPLTDQKIRRGKMKKNNIFISMVALVLTASSISFAADNQKSKVTKGKLSFEMMSKRMSDMQKEMTKIQNTKDPKKKQILLDEHMKNMQTQMNMMGTMMKDMGMMSRGKGQGRMMGQMGQMHGMMGQMMGQMQEHMNACPFVDSNKKE